MRTWPLLLLLPALLAGRSTGRDSSLSNPTIRGVAVIQEMNRARQHPREYAEILVALRSHYQGNVYTLPNGTRWNTHEGVAAVDEAVRFLRETLPLAPLIVSSAMSKAAAEHVADQAGGQFGHTGSDRSGPADRLNHYGVWSGRWGENISYGKSSAREIVIALIVDDGLRARKHRKNIFNSEFNVAGAAIGPHARYRTVCSIDFAGGYTEAARENEARDAFSRQL